MPAIVAGIVTPSPRRILRLENPEEDSDGTEESGDKQPPRAKRRVNFESDDDDDDDNDDDEEGIGGDGDWMSEEQRAIIRHQPTFGGKPICVDALAGCGKTTTVAALCNHMIQNHPSWKILYLVYGKGNEVEAAKSGKFPKEIEIRTTHAFVMRHMLGPRWVEKVKPVEKYSIDDVIDKTDLRRDLEILFSSENVPRKKLDRRVSTVASFVRNTVNRYQSSDDHDVKEEHVFWKARPQENLSQRTEWRNKISISKYINWAKTYFSVVEERISKTINTTEENGSPKEDKIAFDGFIKYAQMNYDLLDEFNVVIIDECQDMTPCQADLFWGESNPNNCAIYLFGDPYQQLYRFRGAKDSFENVSKACQEQCKFGLTGSWRFGVNIAKVASLILRVRAGDTTKITGLASDKGQVFVLSKENRLSKGTVLCRTNKGMYNYLFSHPPKKWCYLKGGKFRLAKNPSWLNNLETFVWACRQNDREEQENENEEAERYQIDPEPQFQYKEETFHTIDEVYEYIADEGDSDLMRYLDILIFLEEGKKCFSDFCEEIKRSFQPDDGKKPYEGIKVGTVHASKGLEFDDVIINNDFKFDMIKNKVSSEGRVYDEADILYVAVTRAKKKLYFLKYLCPEANDFFDYLSNHFDDDDGKFQTKAVRATSDIRQEWEEAWRVFESTKPRITSKNDIPWINEEDRDNPLALDSNMTEEEQRQYLRKITLRYHPEKFLPTHDISSECLEDVKNSINHTIRLCRDALDNLHGRNMDGVDE